MASLLRCTIALPVFALLALLALLACGSPAGPSLGAPCAANPSGCAAGTTCWPIDAKGGAACLPSKAYKMRGDDCELLVGDTSCGDGLVCVTAQVLKLDGSAMEAFCAGFCDGSHACQAGETCMQLALFDGAPPVSVCVPMALPRDQPQDMSGP